MSKEKIPKNHPRYQSLKQRALIEEGFEKGIVAKAGLIAHGRGETFDYLLGEKTIPEAKKQIKAAAALLVLAEKPIISTNGNTTALVKKEIISLSKKLNCQIEINLFYKTKQRTEKIYREFKKSGARVLGRKHDAKIKGLTSKRTEVEKEGIYSADVVLVMLEDGDRTEFLNKEGKKVVAIDLNPLSRTAKMADISIVDNISRAIPLMEEEVEKAKKLPKKKLQERINKYNNKKLLKKTIQKIRKGKAK